MTPDQARRIAETKRNFAARYGSLPETQRYAAMKAVYARNEDPLERKMAEQFIRGYDAREKFRLAEALAAETDSVSERERIISEATETLNRAIEIFGSAGAAEMRAAAAEAAEVYTAADERAAAVARAKALAQESVSDEADERLAARLAPAARVRALAQSEAAGIAASVRKAAGQA